MALLLCEVVRGDLPGARQATTNAQTHPWDDLTAQKRPQMALIIVRPADANRGPDRVESAPSPVSTGLDAGISIDRVEVPHAMTTSTMSRLHRMRKLAYAPLVAAVAAGAVCTGAGTSIADTTNAPTATDTPQSGSAYNWQLLNHTGQSIYGNWGAEMASGDTSRVETDKDHPWKADDASDKATQFQDSLLYTTWMGHICYQKKWWDYTLSDWGWGLSEYPGYPTPPIFRLEADSTGALFVYYDKYRWTGGTYEKRDALTLETGSVC
ncbi:hypothetical protein [Rhodococcus jostii]|uniref:hypothetical protein n=1 Tax=Rhodococcus jostii TaxID=132919 RepID=UPI00363211E6